MNCPTSPPNDLILWDQKQEEAKSSADGSICLGPDSLGEFIYFSENNGKKQAHRAEGGGQRARALTEPCTVQMPLGLSSSF